MVSPIRTDRGSPLREVQRLSRSDWNRGGPHGRIPRKLQTSSCLGRLPAALAAWSNCMVFFVSTGFCGSLFVPDSEFPAVPDPIAESVRGPLGIDIAILDELLSVGVDRIRVYAQTGCDRLVLYRHTTQDSAPALLLDRDAVQQPKEYPQGNAHPLSVLSADKARPYREGVGSFVCLDLPFSPVSEGWLVGSHQVLDRQSAIQAEQIFDRPDVQWKVALGTASQEACLADKSDSEIVEGWEIRFGTTRERFP
jgi:hypothetical protein